MGIQIDSKQEFELIATLSDPRIAHDPYAFVMFAFPWGQPGTPLERHQGPRSWQRQELLAIRDHIAVNQNRMANGLQPQMFKSATASGRGIGKSALVAWLTLWMMSTRFGSTTVVTANTEDQLKNKTWAEVGKWHTMAVNSHWFERGALSLKPQEWFDLLLKKQLKVDTGYFYARGTLWSEENPDSFAGVHNHNGVMLIKDEASGIPAPIWAVSEGFFTEPILDRYWFVFSNPRRNTGAFFECFHKNRAFWRRRNLDSRTVEGVDVDQLNQIIAQHGDDSDVARVEVKGEFPRQGDKQFISREVVDQAIERELLADHGAPLIMGVDPARFGDDQTVIRFRQGRDARSIPAVKLKGADNMAVANKCAELIAKYDPEAVCVDAGNGTGIIDRLREMGYRVHEVWFGAASDEHEWANKRTHMWAKMREWLKGGMLDPDPELRDDLTAPEYKFQGSGDRLRLETKEEMKRRGFASPDDGDALACTFAINVPRRDMRAGKHRRQREAADLNYSVFG